MLCVDMGESPSVAEGANALSCSEFAEVYGVGVVLAGLAPTGSNPAPATNF